MTKASNQNIPNRAHVAAIFERMPEKASAGIVVSLFGWAAGDRATRFIERIFYSEDDDLCELYGYCGERAREWGQSNGAEWTELNIQDYTDLFVPENLASLGMDLAPFAIAGALFVLTWAKYDSLKNGIKNIIPRPSAAFA